MSKKKYFGWLGILIAVVATGCQNSNQNCENYVEFKLDGVTHRIEDCQGVSSGLFSDNLSLPLYQFVGTFMPYPPDGSGVTLDQVNHELLTTQNYNYTGYNYQASTPYPVFIYVEQGSQHTYSFPYYDSTATGNIEFTVLEKVVGGKVKGSFNFQNVNYMDENQNIISTGHTVTDGTFQIKVTQVQ